MSERLMNLSKGESGAPKPVAATQFQVMIHSGKSLSIFSPLSCTTYIACAKSHVDVNYP